MKAHEEAEAQQVEFETKSTHTNICKNSAELCLHDCRRTLGQGNLRTAKFAQDMRRRQPRSVRPPGLPLDLPQLLLSHACRKLWPLRSPSLECLRTQHLLEARVLVQKFRLAGQCGHTLPASSAQGPPDASGETRKIQNRTSPSSSRRQVLLYAAAWRHEGRKNSRIFP